MGSKEPSATGVVVPLNRAQIVVLALLGLAAGGAYLTRHCIAVANTTIIEELGLTEWQMGWVLGVFSAGYFLFQIPGGWLGHRIGTRKAYALISLLWSLFTVWSSLASSWIGLLASRSAFGAAQAGMVPISASVISDWFQENRKGVCSAVIAASMSLGGVVAIKLTAELMEYFDWRDIFRMYSIVGIVWAAAFYSFFRTLPKDHPWLADSKSLATDGPDADAKEPGSIDWRSLLSNRTICAINLQAIFRAAGYWLFVTWFPAFLEYRFGLTSTAAGSLSTWPLIGVVVGTLLGGVAVDRLLIGFASKRASRAGVAGIALLTCALLTIASAWSANANWFVLLMSLGALFSGGANPSAWAATMDVAGKQTAVVMGMMNMAGTIGGFTMPIVLGYMIGDIKQSGGDWNNVVYLVAAVYLAAAVCWIFVNPDDATTPGSNHAL